MHKLSYFSKPNNHTLKDNETLSKLWLQIGSLRYQVFANELHQYPETESKYLDDPGEHFLTLSLNDEFVGYVSINTPHQGNFRMQSYFSDDTINDLLKGVDDYSSIHEFRGLTISQQFRNRGFAKLLMMGALKYAHQNGARHIIAMGHSEVLPLYREIGMTVFDNHSITVGELVFCPMIASVSKLLDLAGDNLNQIELIDIVETDDACYHGGASWDASGFDFTRRKELIVADVLDSPFPPSPEVMQVIAENLVSSCHESPPTQCAPLIDKIAQVRNISPDEILVSSGSSSLMFSLLPRLLNDESSVLILSPMYGEYLHILNHLINCHITHFPLYPEDGFTIDLAQFVELARQHDAVIVVNPNSPTGVYCDNLHQAISDILSTNKGQSSCRLIWVDETYIEYVNDAVSLESLASLHKELVVCKSMSKCYALSGLRVAYAVTSQAPTLRRFIPPWAVSLPAQLGAIAALSNPDYYDQQYALVHENRAILNDALIKLGFTTFPSVANYILTKLPPSVAHSSNHFIALCRERDVFIRDAENMGVTLDSRYVRFAVKSRVENDKVINCLAELLDDNN